MSEEHRSPFNTRNLVGLAWLFWAGPAFLHEMGWLSEVPNLLRFVLFGLPALLAPVAAALGIHRAQVEDNPWPGFSIFLAAMALIAMNMGMHLSFEQRAEEAVENMALTDLAKPNIPEMARRAADPLTEEDRKVFEEEGRTRLYLPAFVYWQTGEPIWWRDPDGQLQLFVPDASHEEQWQSRDSLNRMMEDTEQQLELMVTWSRREFLAYLCGLLALMPTTFLFLAMRRTRGQGTGFEG